VDAVQVRGAENQEVYLTFSPRFERIWLESKKRLLEYVGLYNVGFIGRENETTARGDLLDSQSVLTD